MFNVRLGSKPAFEKGYQVSDFHDKADPKPMSNLFEAAGLEAEAPRPLADRLRSANFL